MTKIFIQSKSTPTSLNLLQVLQVSRSSPRQLRSIYSKYSKSVDKSMSSPRQLRLIYSKYAKEVDQIHKVDARVYIKSNPSQKTRWTRGGRIMKVGQLHWFI